MPCSPNPTPNLGSLIFSIQYCDCPTCPLSLLQDPWGCPVHSSALPHSLSWFWRPHSFYSHHPPGPWRPPTVPCNGPLTLSVRKDQAPPPLAFFQASWAIPPSPSHAPPFPIVRADQTPFLPSPKRPLTPSHLRTSPAHFIPQTVLIPACISCLTDLPVSFQRACHPPSCCFSALWEPLPGLILVPMHTAPTQLRQTRPTPSVLEKILELPMFLLPGLCPVLSVLKGSVTTYRSPGGFSAPVKTLSTLDFLPISSAVFSVDILLHTPTSSWRPISSNRPLLAPLCPNCDPSLHLFFHSQSPRP